MKYVCSVNIRCRTDPRSFNDYIGADERFSIVCIGHCAGDSSVLREKEGNSEDKWYEYAFHFVQIYISPAISGGADGTA